MKLLSMCVAVAALAAARQDFDEKKEPPMILAIEIDGKKFPVELDKPVELPVKNGLVKATLRAEPHRVFAYGGMRFHYPRDMGFEADFDPEGPRMWTLDGNDAVVMIHRHLGNEDHENVLKLMTAGMIQQYGRAIAKSAPCALELHGKRIKGAKISATIAGANLVQSLYSWRSGKDSVVLVLQDSPDEGEESTAEFRKLLKMFQETFKFQESGK